MKLNNIKNNISRVGGRGLLVVKKYSPEILLGVGVVGIVTSTVMACKATLKVEEVLDEAQEKIEKIKTAKETLPDEKYNDQDYKKDMTIAYVQTGFEFTKLYGPAVTLSAASIACILGSHNIMKKRNVALVAAYKVLEEGFKDYRKRVVDELGEEKDRQFRYGIREEEVVEIDEDGKEVTVTKQVADMNPEGYSVYARFFDEASPEWCKTPEYNLFFLKCQQNWANDLLKARGHVFLNEVYDALGLSRTQAGAIVGWVLGQGDDYIDFGIYNDASAATRRFVNGDERSILLDFNVDGVIYDLI